MYYNKTDHTPHTDQDPPYEISDSSITIIWNGVPHTVSSSSPNYADLKDVIRSKHWDLLDQTLSVKASFQKLSDGDISIEGDIVLYKGQPINNALSNKMLYLLREGFTDLGPWMKFANKYMENPSYNSREQGYKFIEHSNMPITHEGNVIGYKGVSEEYKDIYSGRFDNSIGSTHEMPRTMVDDNVDHGCSAGFHIGTFQYADSWGHNGKLMQVEFSPKDIVSVPSCSQYAKLRVCKYTVVGECFDRAPLADGLYGIDADNPQTKKLKKYLRKRWKKNKTPTLHKIAGKFPQLNSNDIHNTLVEAGGSFQWDINAEDLTARPNPS